MKFFVDNKLVEVGSVRFSDGAFGDLIQVDGAYFVDSDEELTEKQYSDLEERYYDEFYSMALDREISRAEDLSEGDR